ncbi:MAG TPA: SCO family protein [Cytophagales bacterium]|nr:SCO family protein [Cytophagales bacterium]HAA18305.1 SCO family protein [Cytophagales bacterium]HAP63876.1 SCO family protein [Cytophagales bacterium]
MKNIFLSVLALSLLSECTPNKSELPIYGRRTEVDGVTIYHTIPDFTFVNQDSATVTQKDIIGKKVFVADFFFTSCTTICPAMKTQMMRLYEEFLDDDRVALLSHSIDPEYDTQPVLEEYASRLGVSSEKWHFLTGVSQDDMFNHGQQGYIVTATADETVPDGLLHSGAFLLVDTEGRIRGKYDGTIPVEVDRLMADMRLLLAD